MTGMNAQEKILDFLRKAQGYVSGEEASARLKISRQALWKHIQQLKDAGFEIVAVPHLGYKLLSCPDRLFSSAIAHNLHTRIIGKKIYYFGTLPSTMDMAERLAQEGAPEGTLVVAETQTKGRGRLGRSWASPKYKGIYFSLVLRPALEPAHTPILTLLSAVGVAEGIQEACGIEVKIKWPNDLMVGGKKVGGILTELAAETDATHFVTIGVGLNINNEPHSLVAGATSLKEQLHREINRVALLQESLRRIELNYSLLKSQGSESIAKKWRALSLTLGTRVMVKFRDMHVEGIAFDIDSDGALLIRQDTGLVQKMSAGDVAHCTL